ncbi:hypothetical protein PAMP_016888 [Pampus punctatissimus]
MFHGVKNNLLKRPKLHSKPPERTATTSVHLTNMNQIQNTENVTLGMFYHNSIQEYSATICKSCRFFYSRLVLEVFFLSSGQK